MSELSSARSEARELLSAEFLNQHYQIACTTSERELLRRAISLLHERLAEASVQSSGSIKRERTLLMVALNLAADLQRSQEHASSQQDQLDAIESRLQGLVDRARGAE